MAILIGYLIAEKIPIWVGNTIEKDRKLGETS